MKLDEYQKDVVEHSISPDEDMLVLASAGAGKTRSMIYRVKYLLDKGISPEDIVAVSFTSKSADELEDRLSDLSKKGSQVEASTFHSLGYKVVREQLNRNNVLTPNNAKKLIHRLLISEKWDKEEGPDYFYNLFGQAKMDATEECDMASYFMREDHENGKLVNRVYEKYEKNKQRKDEVDYSDMIYLAWDILKDSDVLCEKYSPKYMIVDECQDLNRIQYELADLLSQGGQLTFVADPQQSIYGFRGANVDRLFDYSNRRGMDIKKLENNYRSTKRIVDKSNELVSNSRFSEKCPKANCIRNDTGNIGCTLVDDQIEESEVIAEKIKDLHKHKEENLDDIAIVYRVNAQSQYLEMALQEEDIPYNVHSRNNFFNRKEIKDCLAYLRIIDDLKDMKSVKRIYNQPTRFLGKDFWGLFRDKYQDGDTILNTLHRVRRAHHNSHCVGYLIQDIDELLQFRNASPEKAIERIFYLDSRLEDNCTFFDLYRDEEGDGTHRTENLNAFKNMASNYDSIKDFINMIEYRMQNVDTKKDDKVQLMTTHKAKGLEFKNVFVAGFSDTLFPHEKGDFEEERRIAYVAVTRAEDRLYITVPSRVYGEPVTFSPFLKEMNLKPKLPKFIR